MAHYRNIHRLIACSAVQKSPWPPRVFKDLALFLCRENAFLSKWSPDSVFHWNNSSCLLAPAASTRLCQSDSRACRVSLEICKLSSSSINVRLSAVRKPALEAAQNGLLDYALAAGILGVKGVKEAWSPHRPMAVVTAGPDACVSEPPPADAMLESPEPDRFDCEEDS
jgi:hypothetical protein